MAFVSGAQTNPGNAYAPASDTDTALCWIAGAYGVGTASGSAQDFGGSGMTEPAAQDQTLDLAGNGDPSANASYLVNPGTSSSTLSLTWSSGRAGDVGYAFTVADIDQSTPISGTPTGGTYTNSGSGEPSLTYSAENGDVVVYWRYHARGGGAISWTDPTDFTQRSDIAIITSPARRSIAVWTRDVTSSLVGATVQASESADGDGLQGCFVLLAAGGGGGVSIPVIMNHLRNQGIS